MNDIIKLIFLLAYLLPAYCIAQVRPGEGSKLNYRIIGFSFPTLPGATAYKVEIMRGNIKSEELFIPQTIKPVITTTNKAIIEVPEFGQDYTWRVTDNKNNKSIGNLHHFSTLKNKKCDTNNYRLRIIQQAEICKNALVFNDKNKVMYNMKGEPVWFLPDIKDVIDDYSVVRDLKITPQNTITFLTFNMAYEINYDAQILWSAPNNGLISGDSEEHYHHEVTRLANGHYMVLAEEIIPFEWKHNDNGDSTLKLLEKPKIKNAQRWPGKHLQMGTIIEYDEKGNVVWSWKSSTYYKDEQLKKLITPQGLNETHENAFWFDEKNKIIYISFKNTYQLLKVKYPEGTVLAAYGGLEYNSKGEITSLFSEQHACKRAQNGNILLYNNNMAHPSQLPNVLILREPANRKDNLKQVWKYEYPETIPNGKREIPTSGGNITELPGNAYFVSTCVPFANIYIVNRNKKLLWDAVLEYCEPLENKWEPAPQYRASIILNKERLEKVIWKAAEL